MDEKNSRGSTSRGIVGSIGSSSTSINEALSRLSYPGFVLLVNNSVYTRHGLLDALDCPQRPPEDPPTNTALR
jgi:hypothetical protein